MISEDQIVLEEWGRRLALLPGLRLSLTSDKRAGDFQAFGDALQDAVPGLKLKRDMEESTDPPGIWVGDAVCFHLIPQGRQLQPFLETAQPAEGAAEELGTSVRKRLEGLRLPVTLTLYVLPSCPFCPEMVRRFAPLALQSPWVRLYVIDGALFPELAQQDDVRSAPTLLSDRTVRWTGAAEVEEVLDVVLNRNPASLDASTLERMIVDGNAQALAELMLSEGVIVDAFPDLLVHPWFTVRLGAMVAAEELASRNPALAASLVQPLWHRFPGAEEPVKGDILYTLGEVGDATVLERLRGVRSASHSADLQEAAQDAIQRLEERTGNG
jgi:hypothetical protein